MDLRSILGNQQRPDGNALDMLLSALAYSNVAQPAPVTQQDLQAVQALLSTPIEAPEPQNVGLPTPSQPLPTPQPAGQPQSNQAGWKAFLDAKTGEDRVNALTSEHGVRAVRDPATGRVTLTNLDESGKPTAQSQKQIYGWNPKDAPGKGETNTFAPTDPAARNNIDQIMDQIAKAEDSATAEGLIRGLNSAVAEEKVRLEQQAFKFAEEELGIPQLRDAVEALKRRDSSQSMVNGIPYVSKEYLDATNQLSQRQAAANQRANEWLTRNISWNRLGATEASAKVLLERKVTKLGAAEAKEAERQQRYGAVFESIPESQRELIYRVNPAIKDKPEETVKFIERAKNDKDFMAFVNSAAHERVGLALSGNNYAFRYAVEEEAARTGKPIQQVEQDLIRYTKQEPNERMIKAFVEANASTLGNAEERKSATQQQIAAINQLRISSSAKDKQEYAALKAQILARSIQATKTSTYIEDVSNWGLQDPELQAAISKARETTGSASLDKVLTSYLSGKEGDEALAAIQAFKTKIKAASAREANSMFGGVDEAAILNVMNNAIIQSGSLANWIRTKMGMALSTSPNVNAPAISKQAYLPGQVNF